jgi:thioredoxin reductase (NADPH)
VERDEHAFLLQGQRDRYTAQLVLLATGMTHLPPKIPEVRECLGRSLFFCKDCDGYRVQGGRIGIIGRNNEAVKYAVGMLIYSPTVIVATNGEKTIWDPRHADLLEEYRIPQFRKIQLRHSTKPVIRDE